MNRRGTMRFDLRGSFLFYGSNHNIEPLCPSSIENKKWKSSVAGNEAKPGLRGTHERSLALRAKS